MAVGIYFDGRRIIRPQAVTKIDDSGMYGRGLGGANVLAVIGESTGGQPKTVQWFTDPSYAKTILRSGNLLKAIQRAYDPSAEVPGAYTVAAIRVNPALQSELVLADGLNNPLVLVKSVDYGIWNNQIKVRIETGTLAGTRKATVTYGTSYDQGDNIRRQSFFLGCADPLARTASYTISIPVVGTTNKRLSTAVVGNFQKVLFNNNTVWTNYTTEAKELDASYFDVGLEVTNDELYFGSDRPFNSIDFNKGVRPDSLSGTGTGAVTTTTTKLTDTRLALAINAYVGAVITCNVKTMTVTANDATSFTGASWSGGGTPGDGNAWTAVHPNVQNIASAIEGHYWNGTAWATAAITDGTKGTSNKPFSTNGYITFTQPSSWAKNTVNAETYYWIRIRVVTAQPNLDAGAQGDYTWLGKGITVDLSLYPTIQELVDYLDSLSHYEVGVVTSKPDSEYSYNLDDVNAVSMMSGGNTTLSVAYSSGTTLRINELTNFAVGDYITISRLDGTMEEARRITSKSGTSGVGTLGIDSALSTTYPITTTVVREAAIVNSNLQALIDWFGESSAYVTATHIDQELWEANTAYVLGHAIVPTSANGYAYVVSVAGTSGSAEPTWGAVLGVTQTDNTVTWKCVILTRGVVANIGDTYMNGGTEGVTSNQDWSDCLELLQNEDTNLVTCVTPDPAVWASLSTHCSYMSTVGKRERIGFCGGFASSDGYTSGLGRWNNSTTIAASINAMLAYALQLNSDRMVYVGPGFTAYDENGTLTTYSGAISAALVAGMASGVDVAEPLTHKSIKVIGLEYNFKWADLDRLLEGGICPLEYDPGRAYRVCQSITTWLRNDKYNRREVSVRRTADYVARQVRDRLEMDFVGTKGTLTTLISIKNATTSVLTQMVRLELLAGDAANPPYKNIQVRLDGDTAYVDFECSPVIPINYIPVTIHLTVFTTTLTA